jgi:hypothetical protein
MALNTTRIGELLGVDPNDSNALALAVKDFLALGATSTISTKTRRSEDFLGLGATLADNPSVLITQSGTPLTPPRSTHRPAPRRSGISAGSPARPTTSTPRSMR